MEEINKELENKSIERSKTEIQEVVTEEPKPKKNRTEAQKQAFEKARKKREENLRKKKEQEELDAWAEEELENEEPQPVLGQSPAKQGLVIKAPPKKRGRPRKTINQEPPTPRFIPPPDPQLAGSFGFGQTAFNPYNFMYGIPQVAPQPAPAPVNNYYYYGNAPAPQQADDRTQPQRREAVEYLEPEPSPEPSDEEIDYDTYANHQASLLKYRFA